MAGKQVSGRQAALIAHLEAYIAARKPGQEMPREVDLIGPRWGSRTTVRGAVADLAARGLIEGGGPATRWKITMLPVLPVPLARYSTRTHGGEAAAGWFADAWTHAVARLGYTPTERVTPGLAPIDQVAAGLGMGNVPGIPLTARRVLRLVDGREHNEVLYWFPDRVAADAPALAEQQGSIPGGSLAYIAQCGHRPTGYALRIRSRVPDEGERDRLRIARGISLLIVWRAGYADDGLPVFCSRETYPDYRAELVESGGSI